MQFVRVCAMLLGTVHLWQHGFAQNQNSLAEELRISVETTINGSSVPLAFDTGATESFIFHTTAQRLNIQVDPVPADRSLPDYVIGYTGPVLLRFADRLHSVRLAVVKVPEGIDADVEGVISWNVFPDATLLIKSGSRSVIIERSLPPECLAWQSFPLRTDTTFLAFRTPDSGEMNDSIYIDTGKSDAVSLNPILWHPFVASQRNQLASIFDYYTPEVGFVFAPVRWADTLAINDIVLFCVTVKPEPQALADRLYPGHVATLGMRAFDGLSLAVDRKRGRVYIKPERPADCTPPEHNMLGAVFLVEVEDDQEHLVARVAEGSLAESIGIKNGDILLRIDDLDVTQWKTDPKVSPISRFWEGKEGKQLSLFLMRDNQPINLDVFLEPALVRQNAREK